MADSDDDDVEALARALAGRSLASAESLTGGMLSQRIARTEGSSDWYRGGLVAYQREIKFELLDVTPGPVVTERAAREMASGVAKLFQRRRHRVGHGCGRTGAPRRRATRHRGRRHVDRR